MNILLIQPPIQDFYRTQFREYPLGLLYLAAALDKAGQTTKILDARKCKKPKKIPIPKQLEHLSNFYHTDSSLFKAYYHFGMSDEEIRKLVKEYAPDILLINAMFTPYVNETLNTARVIKQALPHVRIFMGGHHATADPNSLLVDDTIDCVIRGEGEVSLSQILENQKLPRIYPEDKPLRIDDLDSIHPPAREKFNSNDYQLGRKPYTMILTSRGCPHQCSFCSAHTLSGHSYRTHSVDYVLDEIDGCVKHHGIQIIDLQDDNLLYDPDRIKILFEKIILKYDNQCPEFMASNGLNVAHLDLELLKLMKQVGFLKLDLAIATGACASRKKLNRPETLSHYEMILEQTVQLGVAVTTYIILGIPTQPLTEMKETIKYLKTKPTLISPSIFYNVPGMPIFDKIQPYEHLHEHLARRSSAINCFGDDFRREDIVELLMDIRTHNQSKIK
ncbi:MAG: hypothetical protein COS89_03095 [Deltaproteobacteria bacterium CG07_land_8_20_14_0_80_38_7]|nr:MAG: hypothetical protein COS89_03095 [Deltaproteobacteria bacterium CG07_land_8_20_14_0_80_38_7]